MFAVLRNFLKMFLCRYETVANDNLSFRTRPECRNTGMNTQSCNASRDDDNIKHNGGHQPSQRSVLNTLTKVKTQNAFQLSDFPEHFGAFKGRGKTSVACRSHT